VLHKSLTCMWSIYEVKMENNNFFSGCSHTCIHSRPLFEGKSQQLLFHRQRRTVCFKHFHSRRRRCHLVLDSQWNCYLRNQDDHTIPCWAYTVGIGGPGLTDLVFFSSELYLSTLETMLCRTEPYHTQLLM